MNNTKQEFKNLLRELCSLRGISGHEQKVIYRMASLLKPLCDTLEIDNFGNITAYKKGRGTAPSLMLAAHADEVGCIISEILPNGLLKFRLTGLISENVLPSTKVWVDDVPGVIGAPPAHTAKTSGLSGSITLEQLYIDIGAKDRMEAMNMGINIGSPVSFATELSELGNTDRLCGKSVDNRVGCALLVMLMQDIKDYTPEGDLYAVVTVREETNMSGAKISANRIQPDFAIAIDTIPASDIDPSNTKFGIGEGPVIQLIEGVQSAFVGTVIHPGVKAAILNAASSENIKVQLSAEIGSWTTDASAIHSSGRGVPTGFISIARRYAHSPAEVIDVNDALDSLKLLNNVVKNLGSVNLSFVENI